MKFLNFFLLFGSFLPRLNPDPIRIRLCNPGKKTELERLQSKRKDGEGIKSFVYLVKMPEQLTGLALSESALVHCASVVCNTQICTGTGIVSNP
jgi:hypothetical protein